MPAQFQLDPQHRVTPIDSGDGVRERRPRVVRPQRPSAGADVARRSRRSPPTSKLLVVENPATSSPGLAFLLATISALRRQRLARTTGRRCAPTACGSTTAGTQAYDTDFTACGASGDRPLVVSYATDPAADVVFSERQEDHADGRCRAGHLLRAGRVRGRARTARRIPTGARALDRLHAVARPYQEGIPAPDVRVPGA